MSLRQLRSLLCASLALMAISSAQAATLPVLHAESHTQCPWRLVGPQARVLTSAAHWNDMMTLSPERAMGQPVDWDLEHVLVFALDEQPNLGVAVQVHGDVLKFKRQRAVLQVRVLRPQPGEMSLTALSRPCVLARVPQHRWRRLEVRDVDTGPRLWSGNVRHQH